MRVSSWFALLVALLAPPASDAQVIESEQGKIEFLGLKQWTPVRLADTLKALDPGRPLHACAATLTQTLGFSDASVMIYPDVGELYAVVTVIEPGDSARVRYRPAPPDTLQPLNAWNEALEILNGRRGAAAFHMGLQYYGLLVAGHADSARAELAGFGDYADPEEVRALWTFLQGRDGASDREKALWTLTNDGKAENRTVAAAILANFSDSDLVWWRLVDALRDPSPQVRMVTGAVLAMLSKHATRDINWEPAIVSLRWLLGGTNLVVFPSLLEILQRTSFDPQLAQPLLSGKSDLLLAHARAEHERTREAARDFLTYISGRDHDSTAEWERWLDRLPDGS